MFSITYYYIKYSTVLQNVISYVFILVRNQVNTMTNFFVGFQIINILSDTRSVTPVEEYDIGVESEAIGFAVEKHIHRRVAVMVREGKGRFIAYATGSPL